MRPRPAGLEKDDRLRHDVPCRWDVLLARARGQAKRRPVTSWETRSSSTASAPDRSLGALSGVRADDLAAHAIAKLLNASARSGRITDVGWHAP